VNFRLVEGAHTLFMALRLLLNTIFVSHLILKYKEYYLAYWSIIFFAHSITLLKKRGYITFQTIWEIFAT